MQHITKWKCRAAFNQAAHEHLVAQGYKYEAFEADFDDGDPENGPGYGGSPAYDLYTGELEIVGITELGEAGRELRDLEAEKFFEGFDPCPYQ